MSEKGSNKKPGWHSRRHQDSAAHEAAKTVRLERETAKLDTAKKRQEEALLRTPEEQLARLDARGAVAVKERAKLQARIDERERKTAELQARAAAKQEKAQ